MFYLLCDELKDIYFAQSLMIIIDLLKEALKKFLVLTESKLNKMLDCFFLILYPVISRIKYKFCPAKVELLNSNDVRFKYFALRYAY